MSDIGSSCGPALLSFLAGACRLAAGIAVTGLIAFARRGTLAYWIPRHGSAGGKGRGVAR
jgi:hypothetical protein